MPEPASGPPTKTIIGPDGNPIRYPNFPGVGESYHKPDTSSPEHSTKQNEPSPETAPVASQSSNESWHERVMSAARSAIEKAGAVGHAAAQALVLDDWKALTDSHSTPLQRIEGGADLASWAIPEGQIAEIAGHAVAKAAEVAAAHLTPSGVEHLGEAAVATAAFRSTARPLTDAERSGHFKSAQDFKDFMGPATETGGPKRDWHHIVEKTHADNTGQFAPERVHSVENMVPVPRGTHQGAGGLSTDFGTIDRRLGTNLRERLEGLPWEEHVDQGEQALRRHGLDPEALRAETRDRFESRTIEHDRAFGNARNYKDAQIVAPGLLLGATGQDQSQNHVDAASQRAVQWSPDMPFQDFEKIQAQVRGGSHQTAGLTYERDGTVVNLAAGRSLEGTIQQVDGDRIVQHIGRGETATWSRDELSKNVSDKAAFDAMMQPGHYVSIGADKNGNIDAQLRLPDHAWQGLNGQQTQSAAQSLGHSIGQ